MIKLESAHIEELRGIRKLDINFNKGTFAISGPNGTGKSGVIDAIEFGLTGEIGRLTGRGTKGLSVSEHAPHVDKTKFPDAALVELKVFIPALGKSATITRKVSSPHKPKITPDDDDVKAALTELADHPEITLSRREILRFILVEPTKRSEEIQTILKLEEIGQLRSALNAAENKLTQMQKTAVAQVEAQRAALQRHFQIATLRPEDVLKIANVRRHLRFLALLRRCPEKLGYVKARAHRGPQAHPQEAVHSDRWNRSPYVFQFLIVFSRRFRPNRPCAVNVVSFAGQVCEGLTSKAAHWRLFACDHLYCAGVSATAVGGPLVG
jgi:AAA domain-containing protein